MDFFILVLNFLETNSQFCTKFWPGTQNNLLVLSIPIANITYTMCQSGIPHGTKKLYSQWNVFEILHKIYLSKCLNIKELQYFGGIIIIHTWAGYVTIHAPNSQSKKYHAINRSLELEETLEIYSFPLPVKNLKVREKKSCLWKNHHYW